MYHCEVGNVDHIKSVLFWLIIRVLLRDCCGMICKECLKDKSGKISHMRKPSDEQFGIYSEEARGSEHVDEIMK